MNTTTTPAWAALQRLDKFKPTGPGQWKARCPAHEDRNPSLSIAIGDDGRILQKCHAGCTPDAIVAAEGLTMADLYPGRVAPVARQTSSQRKPPVVTHYHAITEEGEILGVHVRKDYLNADGTSYQKKKLWWQDHGARSPKDMPLYNLPRLRAAPDARVFLVEGEKTADALTRAGVLALGTMTGSGAIPCDDSLRPLVDHAIVLWPDNDDAGGQHMRRIADRLIALGQTPDMLTWVNWPDAPAKGDAADFFAAGHTVDDLVALITDTVPTPPSSSDDAHAAGTKEEDAPLGESAEQAPRADADDAIPYEATSHGLVWKKQSTTREGKVVEASISLANFTAQIVADITEDDGAETRRHFELEATLRGRTSRFTVPADRFAAMGWPVEHLGATAILYPGMSVKEHARTAIQLLSRDIPQRRIYTHTGWITLESGPVYLHAGGAVGATGALDDVSVALQGDLRAYMLPDLPSVDELRNAVRASLKLLDLAHYSITFPLFASIWLPPVAEADTSLYLAGQTGAGKSELAALAQQHYGAAMDARHLPASWSSSGNALEALAFLAKDALLVIDDFVPAGSTADIQRQHRDADRVLRAQGNHSARQRMRADTSLRASKPPRGMILSTGEDIPRGHSLRGRMFILEVEPGSLRWNQLAACQADARNGLYAQAMAGYLQWLAGRLAEKQASRGSELAKLRTAAFGSSLHRRTPEIVAKLAYGLHTFLEFARYVGAIGEEEQKTLWQRGWKALGGAAEQQTQHQNTSEPTRRFLELVNAALTAHTAHLATPAGEKPGTYEQSWGWEKITVGSGENMREEWRAQGDRIGWLDGNNVYLEPQATYTLTQRAANTSGDPLSVTLQVLKRRLKERRLLASTEEKRETVTIRRTCEGRQHDVLHFTLETLSSYNPPDKPDIGPTHDDESASMPPALSGFAVGKSGHMGNPTRYPTPASAEYSATPTANVGFVGFPVGGETHSLGEAVAQHPSMLGGVSYPPRHPTTKPDISVDDTGFADVDQTGKGSDA